MAAYTYLRGGALFCSAGADFSTICDNLQHHRVRGESRPIHGPQGTLDRPYFGIGENGYGRGADRCISIIDESIRRAIAASNLSPEDLREIPIFSGTTGLTISLSEEYFTSSGLSRDPETLSLKLFENRLPLAPIFARLGLDGPHYSFTTACTSSANALLAAHDLLVSGRYRHALVLGLEFENALALNGFESLKLLSPTTSRPFDATRDGIVLGEACAAAVISLDNVTSNNVAIFGGVNRCSTQSLTASDTTGVFGEGVMREALKQAGVEQHDIVGVKMHGTGSDNNDLAEAAALARLFGDRDVPFTSYKGALGHTLGACGLAEFLITAESMRLGFLPPTAGFTSVDPLIGRAPSVEPIFFDRGAVMLNYFGFGGNSTAIVVGRS